MLIFYPIPFWFASKLKCALEKNSTILQLLFAVDFFYVTGAVLSESFLIACFFFLSVTVCYRVGQRSLVFKSRSRVVSG